MNHGPVQSRLLPLVRRQRAARLWTGLALCWLAGCVVLLVFLGVTAISGWRSPVVVACLVILTVGAAGGCWIRYRRAGVDWRGCARMIESRRPELNGRLMTAIEQRPNGAGEYTYLQHRLIQEVLAHNRIFQWERFLPGSRLGFLKLAHALTFAAFLVACFRVGTTQTGGAGPASGSGAVVVTPGDTLVERGARLVVMARFNSRVPAEADLVLQQEGRPARRLPLVRSLEDPVFGGSVPEVAADLQYHVEYDGARTRAFEVRVFDYPGLERADVVLDYPDYTGWPPKRIDDTRRVTAVRGTRVALRLQLNKPVKAAQLIPGDAADPPVVLDVDPEQPEALLTGYELIGTERYALRLLDAAGRSNKVETSFFFQALSNQAPELRIVAPRGDLRPSPLEEVRFQGTVFDDFGVLAFGLAYVVGGQEIRTVELGGEVPGNKKRSFEHTLALEELDLEAGDLVSWFFWSEDTGPDGQIRRTLSDLHLAEIRPFEEIFRQGQSQFGQMDSGQESAAGQGGGQTGRLVELQQQIIHATWTLQRRQGGGGPLPAVPPQTSVPRASGERAVARGSRLNGFLRGMLESTASPMTMQGNLLAQRAPGGESRQPDRSRAPAAPASRLAIEREGDLEVVIDAQQDVIRQALEARQQQRDPEQIALWDEAIEQMDAALQQLTQATNRPSALSEAFSAQQAAYQQLLKLLAREYSVSQNQRGNRSGNQSGRQQQMQRQLDQLDLVPEESRYETERLAQAPQSAEQREQLQVMSRLAELARRQQDINERLQELQVALQAAESEEAREEARRELKRLQEEQQRMLSDLDELRQRLDSEENRSRFAEQSEQLENTRDSVQRAAEAAGEEAVSQALAAGTRAQREMEQMREDLRNQSASAFAEDMRRLRAEARQLARQQAELQDRLEELDNAAGRSLGESAETRQVRDRLRQQREDLTNLVQQASQVSQLAEQAEPLMSARLYDALREFSQDDLGAVKQVQEDLLANGLFPLYERLKPVAESSETKTLDMISDVLDEGYFELARDAGRRALADTGDLARGIEQAAELVLGDDAEALRWAEEQLETLTGQLEEEIADATASPGTNNQVAASAGREGTEPAPSRESAPDPGDAGAAESRPESAADASGNGRTPSNPQESTASAQGDGRQTPGAERGPDREGTPDADNQEPGSDGTGRGTAGTPSGAAGFDLERFLNDGGRDGPGGGGPITGDDFGPWSDRLREIEEIVEDPGWRNQVTRARERARQLRRDYTRNQQKPDWAQVRLDVVQPLVEVREAIGGELARRESRDTLAPIDRDPVPDRYSELVRRYYEALGRDSD